MRKKNIILLFILCIAITVFACSINKTVAGEASDTGLQAKIDRIISNQEQILKKLDDMSSELQIVKIRATR
jgi:outer membrane lipoprotein-sorting protein